MDYEEHNFKVEIFRMKGRDEAFGIYSVSVFRCDRESPVSENSCISQYQVQFCKGDYYVNVINNSGSKKGLESSEVIAGIIAGMIEGDSFDPAEYLSGYDMSKFSKIILVKGGLGLYNGASDWEVILGGIEGYTAVIAYREGKVVISVQFDNPEMADKFFNSRKDMEPAILPGNKITIQPGERFCSNWVADWLMNILHSKEIGFGINVTYLTLSFIIFVLEKNN
ncbi:MAG: DUF6599 family protein [Bacteroidales bacterium]